MKLKAYHDRELAWTALRDDAVMARRIPTADRSQVRQTTVGHYYRKAGKDLYDIAVLAAHRGGLGDALGHRARVRPSSTTSRHSRSARRSRCGDSRSTWRARSATRGRRSG